MPLFKMSGLAGETDTEADIDRVLYQMVDLDVAPCFSQVFSNQAPMAVVRLMLAAQKGRHIERGAIQGMLYGT